MGSQAEERAALVMGVRASADPTASVGIWYRQAATTSLTSLAVPTALRGKWVNIFSSGAAVQYAFGVNAAPALVYNQAVTAGTGNAAGGGSVPAGQITPRIVPSAVTHLSFRAETAAGYVELYCSESLAPDPTQAVVVLSVVIDGSGTLVINGSGNQVVA